MKLLFERISSCILITLFFFIFNSHNGIDTWICVTMNYLLAFCSSTCLLVCAFGEYTECFWNLFSFFFSLSSSSLADGFVTKFNWAHKTIIHIIYSLWTHSLFVLCTILFINGTVRRENSIGSLHCYRYRFMQNCSPANIRSNCSHFLHYMQSYCMELFSVQIIQNVH